MPPPGNSREVELPWLTKPLNIDWQDDKLIMWALVNPNTTLKRIRKFATVGTGWALPDDAEHIGTVHQGPMVWHVIEYIKEARNATT
jgi:hypothetical protein